MTFGLLVVDLFANSISLLVCTAVALVMLWVVATIHHAIGARQQVSLIGGRTAA